MIAQAHLGLGVVHRRRKHLAVHPAQAVGVEEEAPAPFAGLEEKVRVDQQGAGRAEILIVGTPVCLPVLRHEVIEHAKRC